MTSLLEERYRRVLRMLPADYRRRWADDMVSTFLERAHAAAPDDPEGVEIGSPHRAEVASVAALALRLRLGGGGNAAPRTLAWAGAIRRLALVGLLAHTVVTLVGVLLLLWGTQGLPGLTIPDDAGQVGFTDHWQALWHLTGLLWLPVYLAAVYGHRRVARLLAPIAFLPLPIAVVVDLLAHDGAFAASRLYGLLFDLLPVLALAAFHRDAPPLRPRPWLVMLPVSVVLAFVGHLLAQPATGGEPLLDQPGLWCVGLTLALLVAAADRRVGRSGLVGSAGRSLRTPPWTLAFALLVPAVLGLRLVTLVDQLTFATPGPNRHQLMIVVGVEVAALSIAALLVAVRAARILRSLPPTDGAGGADPVAPATT